MKKNHRFWLVLLIVLCMSVIIIGGFNYIFSLQKDLEEQSINNVLTVTQQQQQAFDNFISGDRERLHSYAQHFHRRVSGNMRDAIDRLDTFGEVDAFYTVMNLESGEYCNNKVEETFHMDAEDLAFYRSLSGSGVRRPLYQSLYAQGDMFGYYECFEFSNGERGLIQKSYYSSRVSQSFSLSFYNNQGLAYVVNQDGDILLRSIGMIGDRIYNNIFDVLTEDANGHEENVKKFEEALSQKSQGNCGSITFSGEHGDFVYTYVQVENVPEWYLVSVIPLSAISTEADQILHNSQTTFFFMLFMLILCIVCILLIWWTNKDIKSKDREIQYREQLFDIFATYLSRNTDDVYLMIDAKTNAVEYVSPNIERVLGVTEKEARADLKSIGEAQYISGGPVDYETIRSMEAGNSLEGLKSERVNLKTNQYKRFRENVYCTLVQDHRKIIVYISDRTQEYETENVLSEALDMAQVANHAKTAFLSSISHDIRTPMNAIIGFTALLREEPDNPSIVLEYTQRIDAASQHLLGLINDVLDMNKIESGNATLNLTEMDLADIIDEINTIIRPQARSKNQSFEIFTSSLPYEHLVGDKLRINQVLINLLSNAVKYTQEGGEIQMRVEELPQVMEQYCRIRFTISDNGMGMSEEYLKVIFEPFTREETSATRQIQGTGLGMAITKSLVDLMGGSIEVVSSPGQGSTFTIELELYIQEQENDSHFWSEHHISKMIVIDDDEDICYNIIRAMEKSGTHVDYSTNGVKAVDMMRKARESGDPYDTILLDWKMPDLDGLETARLIRKNYSEKVPILLLTAYDWGEIEQEAKEIGVSHFLPKPFFMSTFKQAIRRIMDGQKKNTNNEDLVINGKKIMIVDDVEVNRILLVKILKMLGANCTVAENGREAVEKFLASKPNVYDVILMDVQMPIMNGYEATRAIRASSHPSAKSVGIIAMTANAFVDDIRDAIESGMNAHVAKPIQVDLLKSTIHQVLDTEETAENPSEKQTDQQIPEEVVQIGSNGE